MFDGRTKNRGHWKPRGNFGHGRGSYRYRSTLNKPAVERPPSPPIGTLLETVRALDLLAVDKSSVSDKIVGIVGCSYVASYNWLDRKDPTIVVPGNTFASPLLNIIGS